MGGWGSRRGGRPETARRVSAATRDGCINLTRGAWDGLSADFSRWLARSRSRQGIGEVEEAAEASRLADEEGEEVRGNIVLNFL